MSEIKLFKLTSGEEIMANLTLRGLQYEVEDAVSLVYQPAGDGQMTVGFAPFMPYSNEKILKINPAAIAVEVIPKDQILSEYNRIFSKIQIVSATTLASMK